MQRTLSRITRLSCVLSLGFAGIAFSQPVEEPASPAPQTATRSGLALGDIFSLGIQGDHSSEEDFGVGGRLVVHPDRYVGLEFTGAFDYFFPSDDSDLKRSYFAGSVVMTYKFRDQEASFRPYLGWGLVFGHQKQTLDLSQYGLPDDSWSSTHTQWNGTAGALFGTGRTKLFVEMMYSLEGSHAVVLSAGVRFGGQQKARSAAGRAERPSRAEGRPQAAEEARTGRDVASRACPSGDVGFRVSTDKSTHPTPEPLEGKALVYVLRPATLGFAIQTKLAVDGEWVGANRSRNYFFLNLDPGEHYFCSKSENRSSLAVTLEAGKTYFLEQKIKMGFMKARNKLVLLSDSEGREKLGECNLSEFERKD